MDKLVDSLKELGPSAAAALLLVLVSEFGIPPFPDWELWPAMPYLVALGGLGAFAIFPQRATTSTKLVCFVTGVLFLFATNQCFNWLTTHTGPLADKDRYLRRALAVYIVFHALLGYSVGCAVSLLREQMPPKGGDSQADTEKK